MAARPPYVPVALLSAAALAYELLLLRLFAIIQWHHFAYLAISAALLGIGAAGTAVTIARERLLAAYPASFAAAAAAFALASVAAFAAAQRLPFNALEVLWDASQFVYLAAIYLLLFIPFFLAAAALAIAYARFGVLAGRLYGADILGAGLGSLGLLGLLFLLPAHRLPAALGALGFAAAALALGHGRPRGAAALALAALCWPLLPDPLLRLVPSDYKDLSQALRVAGARAVAERSSPLGVVTAVESPLVPFRHAPGLSLAAASGPPPQLGLFVDGQAAGAVAAGTGTSNDAGYLADSASALPYVLLDRPRVLVLGAGAGSDVIQALALGAGRVDAVELDPQLIALIRQDLAGRARHPYGHPAVRLHLAEARGFVAASRERYDLIQLALLDAFGTSAAGLASLSESHLYTLEAFDTYLERLEPGGILAFSRWLSLPPRDGLRLFATAAMALERHGVRDPGRRLAMIRSWNTVTLLVRNGEFSAGDLDALRDFCRRRAFDLVHLPGIGPDEHNRFNLLERDDLFAGTQALLGPRRQDFLDRYKFDLEPARDDRPYFFQFFRWRSLPELLEMRARGVLPPLDWGYPVLLMALIQAVPVSLALILLPLALGPGRRGLLAAPAALRKRVLLYFLVLGLGFMAVEIPLLQRFSLFLSHPVYGAAAVLAGILVFAGLGARHSARLAPGRRWPFLAIALLTLTYGFALPPLLAALMGLPVAGKLALTLALLAPLAYCLGLPFPAGLAAVARRADPLVPWALAINGFASVVATLLATLLAIHWGQTAVLLVAAGCYGVAASCFPDRT